MQGVGPYEVKLVLHHLIVNEKLFTLAELNDRIAHFPYGRTDAKNRPSEIGDIGNVRENNKLRQKALQFFCLFRLLPLMIADLIPEGNAFWQFFLDLRVIGDMLFAQKWTRGLAERYKEKLADHLLRFTQLFPDFRLKPKHHYLTHYATFAKMSGPPVRSMVSSEEMKGNHSKRTAHIMCNFRNPSYSLAFKHQIHAFLSLSSHRLLNESVEVLTVSDQSVASLPCWHNILSILGVSAEQCSLISHLVVSGQTYCEGDIIVRSISDDGTVEFGRLIGAVMRAPSDTTSLLLVFEALETIDFTVHRHCYIVSFANGQQNVVKFSDLVDYHPLDCYSSRDVGKYFVCPRYSLM